MGYINDYLTDVRQLLERIPEAQLEAIADAIYTCFQDDGHLLMMGNGGSGSTASHFANDFQKGLLLDGGKPFRALSLCDSISIILAWGNDTEYANIFEPQVRTWCKPGDVVLGISGSGNSENVIRAIRLANELGATTVGLAGMGGGRLAQTAKLCVTVDSHNMQKIEDAHCVLMHCLYSALRDRVIAERKQGVGAV